MVYMIVHVTLIIASGKMYGNKLNVNAFDREVGNHTEMVKSNDL